MLLVLKFPRPSVRGEGITFYGLLTKFEACFLLSRISGGQCAL